MSESTVKHEDTELKQEENDLTFDEEFKRAAEDQKEEEEEQDRSEDVKKRPREDEEEDDEEDEDDDDDEDDDEDEVSTKRRKRRKGANQFFDIEAEVDDDEEEEDDEEDEEAAELREEFITDDHAHDDNDTQTNDDRLHRQYDRFREQEEERDAEQIAADINVRHKNNAYSSYKGETFTSGTVSQKLLMPSINDPSIYAIRCTPGREKDLVRKLYQKKLTLERQGNPLDILTVFQRDSFRGYIYIEAKRPDAIDKALVGMVNVFIRDKLLVPVKEYPDLLKQVKSSDVEILPGIYVRISRGKYKGDLAIVQNLSENGLEVLCKVVPRLDYGKNVEFDADGNKIRSKTKPPPRLFSEQEARIHDKDNLQLGGRARSFTYRGEEYEDGFLLKDFKLQFIQTKDVNPTLEELDRFQTSEEEGLDLAAIAASLKSKNLADNKSTAFQPGDKVEIRRGEQAKTAGVVLEAAVNEITIRVTDSGDPNFVNQRLTVPANDLRKVFSEGDHVRIVEGKHSDETGLVIKIDGDSVTLVSDQTKEDVRVFVNYLIKATDASSNSNDMNSPYDINDLVELSASNVGVIVKAEKNIYEVLTTDGRLISVKPSGIATKLKLRRHEQVSTDKNGLSISIGDTVKETLGEKGKEGPIIHIYKNALFIKSKDLIENLGIFVTNRMKVVSTKDKKGGPDLTSMNPNLKLPNPSITAGLKTKIGGRDRLLYKDVAVTSGTYKGLKGKVTEADDIYARIELHTKSKKIKVLKNNLNVLIRGEAIPYLRFIGAQPVAEQPNGFSQPNAPAFSSTGDSFSGNRSAWNGGATPSLAAGNASTWGGGRSAWNGGKTPAFSAAGNASTWGGGGNATAYGGAGSTWGRGGGNASVWGNKSTRKGNTSSWGNTDGNTSSWGGGGSSWGKRNDGNSSSWNNH